MIHWEHLTIVLTFLAISAVLLTTNAERLVDRLYDGA